MAHGIGMPREQIGTQMFLVIPWVTFCITCKILPMILSSHLDLEMKGRITPDIFSIGRKHSWALNVSIVPLMSLPIKYCDQNNGGGIFVSTKFKAWSNQDNKKEVPISVKL
jgi:hypothetical protein